MNTALLCIVVLGLAVSPCFSRTLLEEEVTTPDTQAVAAAADPTAAVTPDILRCQWMPNRTIPHGVWPSSCMGMPIGDACMGQCKPGYTPASFPPTVYCNPSRNTDRWGQWGQPRGSCVKIPVKCSGTPCCSEHGSVDKTTCTGDEPGDTCTVTCDPMYSGDPEPPVFKCVYRNDKRSAYWSGPAGQCKLEGPCRAAPCRDIAFAIPDSCAQTWGFKDFTCTCSDFYRWNPQQKICEPASLLSFSVLTPVDDSVQASYIYKYMARRSSEIGRARWQVQDAGTTALNLNDVAIGDATTAWAVGNSGLVKKYDGTSWTVERQGDQPYDLLAAASLGPAKAWVGGTRGAASYWDGSAWADISIGGKQTVQSIAAVSQANGGDVAWLVASDESDPNNIAGYIYKWSNADARWVRTFVLPDVALRGVTVLDKDGAWACGFKIKGPVKDRGVILTYNSTVNEWQQGTIVGMGRTSAHRLMDIHAVDYRNVWVVGYIQDASSTSGDNRVGIVLAMDQNYDLKRWTYTVVSGSTEMFNAISGASPSTTVVVGQNDDDTAQQEIAGPEPRPLKGYPAENWKRFQFRDTIRRPTGSVPADVAFRGVAVKYVDPEA